MARKPKTPAPATTNDDRVKLLEALKFAAIASEKKEGKFAFVCIKDKWLSAENDTFSVGIQVDVSLDLIPQADKFQAALQQCEQQFQLTQIDANNVSIKSGNFRALVPLLPNDDIAEMLPDDPVALITDDIKDGFRACLAVMGKGEKIFHNAALLQASTVCATNGGLALEYWHGINLPGPLNIPKKTLETLCKIDKPLSQFGFSESSVTFYFDDMSFLKTRLVEGVFPYDGLIRLFDEFGNAPHAQLWPDFYVALDAVKIFLEGDTVHFHSDYLSTHNVLDMGASYRVPGLPNGLKFSALYWKAIEPYIKTVSFAALSNKPTSFQSDKVRGLIVGKY